jgi:hypothetical protein
MPRFGPASRVLLRKWRRRFNREVKAGCYRLNMVRLVFARLRRDDHLLRLLVNAHILRHLIHIPMLANPHQYKPLLL